MGLQESWYVISFLRPDGLKACLSYTGKKVKDVTVIVKKMRSMAFRWSLCYQKPESLKLFTYFCSCHHVQDMPNCRAR